MRLARGRARLVAPLLLLAACADGPAPGQEPASQAVRPSPADPAATPGAPLSAAARRRVLDFWRLYREATRLRVAGQVRPALTHYDSALALDPGHGDALYHSGGAAAQLGEYDVAEDRWRRLLAADPSNARAHAQLGALYSCGLPGAPWDLARARQELTRALALNRAETGPQVRLGEIALLQGDEEGAARHLEAARRTNERSVAAHYLVGYLNWRAGRGAEARRALERAVVAAGGGARDASASSEGQTRAGGLLLETALHGPLRSHWQRAADLSRPPTDDETDREYTRVAEELARLRRELSTSNDGSEG